MTNVIYPAQFQNPQRLPWVIGNITIVRGNIYLATSKVWLFERKANNDCEYVDFISEVSVEYIGRNAESLRTVWNTRFPNEQYQDDQLPPCSFADSPPLPHPRHRRTVLRDWVNLTEQLVYEGAA